MNENNLIDKQLITKLTRNMTWKDDRSFYCTPMGYFSHTKVMLQRDVL